MNASGLNSSKILKGSSGTLSQQGGYELERARTLVFDKAYAVIWHEVRTEHISLIDFMEKYRDHTGQDLMKDLAIIMFDGILEFVQHYPDFMVAEKLPSHNNKLSLRVTQYSERGVNLSDMYRRKDEKRRQNSASMNVVNVDGQGQMSNLPEPPHDEPAREESVKGLPEPPNDEQMKENTKSPQDEPMKSEPPWTDLSLPDRERKTSFSSSKINKAWNPVALPFPSYNKSFLSDNITLKNIEEPNHKIDYKLEIYRKSLFAAAYAVLLAVNHCEFGVFQNNYKEKFGRNFLADLEKAQFEDFHAFVAYFPNGFVADRLPDDELFLYINRPSQTAINMAKILCVDSDKLATQSKSAHVSHADPVPAHVSHVEPSVSQSKSGVVAQIDPVPESQMEEEMKKIDEPKETKIDQLEEPMESAEPKESTESEEPKELKESELIFENTQLSDSVQVSTRLAHAQEYAFVGGELNKESLRLILVRIVQKHQGISLVELRKELEDTVGKILTFSNTEKVLDFKPVSFRQIVESLGCFVVKSSDNKVLVELGDDYLPTDEEAI